MSFDLNQILVTAATIDELMGGHYRPQLGQKDSTDRAALRLAAWCRSASSGNWDVFSKRLNSDNLSFDRVLAVLADVKHLPEAPLPAWYLDAQWIYRQLTGAWGDDKPFVVVGREHQPFERLFYALVTFAEARVIDRITPEALALLNESARADLRVGLLKRLTQLYAPLLYSKLVAILKRDAPDGKLPPSTATASTHRFDHLIEDLRATELALIFAEKPVLLRLTAVTVRQWIDTTAELINRLHTDIEEIREKITKSDSSMKVNSIESNLSDPHNFGHSVQILTFEDQTKFVYKPKDLRLDVALHDMIVRFNANASPIDLKTVKTIARDDYGWTEFIEHLPCKSVQDIEQFYRRAGAWLAVFHLFASTDMHYENIIAHAAHPVPIDLEMMLQASKPEAEQQTPETAAFIEANRSVMNSILMVGMLPAYAKNPHNQIFDLGGLNANKNSVPVGIWKNVNTDGMRWMQITSDATKTPNIPQVNGQYAQLGDYLAPFIEGFERYSHFLLKLRDTVGVTTILNPFKKLPVRKVIRNTRFYYMLLQRLKDHRNMSDGVTWSAHAEFLSRLADWDTKEDLLWPLQEAERIALVNLNVPYFVSRSDEDRVSAITGHQTQTGALPGLDRVTERFTQWSALEIERQVQIIKVSTSFLSKSDNAKNARYLFKRELKQSTLSLGEMTLAEEASRIASVINQHAMIKDKSAAWVGLDWLGDSEVGQLITLGPDLYNGSSGIALFLAAHAHYAKDSVSRELALKALARTRLQITLPSAQRWARGLGIGGASGLGSIVYALTIISELLDDPTLLHHAIAVSELFSNELISADRSLDVIGGSAGGILGLLALYRRTQSKDVLDKAIACGEHLLRQPRFGEVGQRSWVVRNVSEVPVLGFSHGAAGFAYALTALAEASALEEFAHAAHECLAYEERFYDEHLVNWPDLRVTEENVASPSQWCHGATGIGLARIASGRASGSHSEFILKDIKRAVQHTKTNWVHDVDTLCCGTLGRIEFLSEAGELLNQPTLGHLSDQRLAQIISSRHEHGRYQWNAGGEAFNLGFFRGLSGMGYTILRKLDPQLPNVLMWA